MENRNQEPRRFIDHPRLAPAAVRRWIEVWLGGVGLALVPVIYGIHCLVTGHAVLPGRGRGQLDVCGSAAVALAIAYIAVGVLGHLHWFWGAYRRLAGFGAALEVIALIVFVMSLSFAICKILSG